MIVKIPKKGDLTESGDWRGITLTSVPSKVFGTVLIDSIIDGVNSKLRDELAGFRSGRGTGDHIFILRNIIEQEVEWQATLYITFVDFEKAFDSVHRQSLWKIMGSYGFPAGNKTGIRWNFTSKLEDLDIADDTALMSSCYTHMQTKTTEPICSKDRTKTK